MPRDTTLRAVPEMDKGSAILGTPMRLRQVGEQSPFRGRFRLFQPNQGECSCVETIRQRTYIAFRVSSEKVGQERR